MKPKFYEFFAGGGMARAGLEPAWKCSFANDVDPLKALAYTINWGTKELNCKDIKRLRVENLPGKADLAWASFPCQDLSIAGLGAGLNGSRSRAFWAFCALLKRLHAKKRAPLLLVLENVVGTLSSKGGRDFEAICKVLKELDYFFGALIIDAVHFVPQSRPRLFIVASRRNPHRSKDVTSETPCGWCTIELLLRAHKRLPDHLKAAWVWWQLPKPAVRRCTLADVTSSGTVQARWDTPADTERLLQLMTAAHRHRIQRAQARGGRTIGAIYRRMRKMDDGSMKQRAEVRLDNLAGCLRTAAGGSSRQIVVSIERKRIRTRLLSSQEGARLMGLPRKYRLPENYYEAFHLLGDGLTVPLVRFLSRRLLLPLLSRPR
jgi:DNA (cytosine-5)-methyltransferase 1